MKIPFLRIWWPQTAIVAACLGLAWTAPASPVQTPQSAPQPRNQAIPDQMEQRLAACTSCHGAHGVGSLENPRIPRLAGKPEGYLLQQLRFFQSGQRKHPAMEYVVRQLSPQYLQRIAHYFSLQRPPHHDYPVPQTSAEELARGRQLAMHGDPQHDVPSCQSCHGPTLTGVKPMIPGLTGLSYQYLRTQLRLWRTQQRASGGTFCMGVVANRMQESDVRAVSAWLASQALPADDHPVDESTLPQPIPGWCFTGNKKGAP